MFDEFSQLAIDTTIRIPKTAANSFLSIIIPFFIYIEQSKENSVNALILDCIFLYRCASDKSEANPAVALEIRKCAISLKLLHIYQLLCFTLSFSSAFFASLNLSTVPTRYPVILRILSKPMLFFVPSGA